MFDIYFRSLTPEQKDKFCLESGVSRDTVRNTYLPKDPLSRRMPRPETMLRMIKASEGKLHINTLLDYFYVSAIFELAKLQEYSDARKQLLKNHNSIAICDAE